MELRDAVALVTGGSEGIGRAIAEALMHQGCKVTITGRREEVLKDAAEELGLDWIVGDVGDETDAIRTVSSVIERHGRLDILVNNAGGYRLFTDDLSHAVPFLELSEEVWDRVMSSNLTTAFLCCKAVLPHMVERLSLIHI